MSKDVIPVIFTPPLKYKKHLSTLKNKVTISYTDVWNSFETMEWLTHFLWFDTCFFITNIITRIPIWSVKWLKLQWQRVKKNSIIYLLAFIVMSGMVNFLMLEHLTLLEHYLHTLFSPPFVVRLQRAFEAVNFHSWILKVSHVHHTEKATPLNTPPKREIFILL